MTRMVCATLHWDGFLVWAVNEENIAMMMSTVHRDGVQAILKNYVWVPRCMNFDESRPSFVRLTWISRSRIGHIFRTLTI